MTQLTIGYSDSEDRLWLVLSDDPHQFWLSRRFCASLLRYLEKALTESCPGGDMQGSLDAPTRVALEHQAAHENESITPAPSTPEASHPAQVSRQTALITSVLLTVDAHKVALELITPGHARTFHLNRAEAHQFLAVLWQHCRHAKWELAQPGCMKEPA